MDLFNTLRPIFLVIIRKKVGKIINTFVVSKREFSQCLKYFSISSESVWCHSEPLRPVYLLPLSTSLSLFRTLWCHHKLHPRNYTFWSFLAFFFLVFIWEKVAFLDHFTSYRHRLDSVGPVHQNQQQIRLDIHICTSQPCYYKHDWLHKHLGTGIHLDLRIKGTKKFPHTI